MFSQRNHSRNVVQHQRITLKTLKIILLILSFITIGCESEQKINGNYSTCHNGLYAELFVANDSMRMATSMEFISGWRKFEIKKDTLYHLYFGEFPDSTKAKIKHVGNNKFELFYPKDSVRHVFEKMNIEIDSEMTHGEFWSEFNKRRKQVDCYNDNERLN